MAEHPVNPEVPATPAPWHLTGDGFILVYWLSKTFILKNGFIPASLVDSFRGGPSAVMLMNYRMSAIGPYQELLFIPGRFIYQGQSFSSITRIYVSTWESVVNGRNNWAIPKKLANFTWYTDAWGVEHIHGAQNNRQFSTFLLKAVGPTLPVTSAFIPPNWRTLLQPDHKILFTKPYGKGKVKIAKCLNINIDADFFPDLSQRRLLGVCKVTDFEVTFPVASTSL